MTGTTGTYRSWLYWPLRGYTAALYAVMGERAWRWPLMSQRVAWALLDQAEAKWVKSATDDSRPDADR